MSENGNRNKKNKIVRAEIPGGGIVLDALNTFDKILQRASPGTEPWKLAKLAVNQMDSAAREMRDAADRITQSRRVSPTGLTAEEYKQARADLGLTQAQIAEYLGVATMTIKRRESGETAINREAELAIRALSQIHLPPEPTKNQKLATEQKS